MYETCDADDPAPENATFDDTNKRQNGGRRLDLVQVRARAGHGREDRARRMTKEG
jgi:hypothetical protein